MDQRTLLVEAGRTKTVSKTALCALFGVSRKTGHKWLRRADELGLAGLADQSRRPDHSPMATDVVVVERLVSLRKEHPTWGARKLLAWLDRNEPWWLLPVASTVTDILKRHGLVQPRQRQRHVTPDRSPLADVTAPNKVWAVDFKGDFRVGDGTRCYPLTVTDAHSRMALCCEALTSTSGGPVEKVLERTFREWGLPDRMRSDNGTPFGTMCTGPLSRVSVWLVKVGVHPEYTRPGKPQDNGRHERFHLTLKQETAFPPARTMSAQQRRFNAFCREYNDDRPHEALSQLPPRLIHSRSLRPFPSKVTDPVYPGHYELLRVGGGGYFRWRGQPHFVAKTLHDELVGLVEVDNGLWEVFFGPHLVARFHERLPETGTLRVGRVLPMSPV